MYKKVAANKANYKAHAVIFPTIIYLIAYIYLDPSAVIYMQSNTNQYSCCA